MKKVLSFFKDKKNILILILDLLFSLLITLRILNDRIELCDIPNINIFLYLLVFLLVSFVFSHFIFNIKNIYNYIYEKRYIISGIILLILVLGKFNGSSIGMWNIYVQPSEDYSYTTIIGKSRAIRSDEWLVNTPYALSQKHNSYKYYSNMARGAKTDMFSSIFTPVLDILVFSRPFNIGYLLLGNEYGLSFYWYGRLIALFLVTFEFFMLITSKKKTLSAMGTISIVGSSVVMWFYSNYIVDLLISGQLSLLLFNRFLITSNKNSKIFYSFLIALCLNWFSLTLYPAWQIPLGYIFLIFAVWIFKINFDKNRKISDYKYLIITIIIVILNLLRFFCLSKNTINIIMSTVYPGNRFSVGGNSLKLNFNYPYSLFYPIIDYSNPCDSSGVFSLFPIPIIFSIIVLYNEKKKNKLLENENFLILLLTLISIIFAMFTIIKIPALIFKITLLKMVPTKRIAPIIGIICIYLIVLTIGKIKIHNLYQYVVALVTSIISSVIIVYICNENHQQYINNRILIVVVVVFLILMIFTYLCSFHKINYYIFILSMGMIGFLNIVLINPVNIGTDVIYKKPLSKKVKDIVKNDPNGRWLSLSNIALGNYTLMNGAKSINSTNIYPNLELWKKLDVNKKNINIYNRYAHIVVNLTENKTRFKLEQGDVFKVDLSYYDIDKIGVNYFILNDELTIPNDFKNNFDLIYKYDNIYIYKYIS